MSPYYLYIDRNSGTPVSFLTSDWSFQTGRKVDNFFGLGG